MSFARLITICISARLLIDIGMQMFNSFLPIVAAGLRTDVVVMGRLVGVRSAMGLTGPFFGDLADRHGYRLVLRGALLVSATGMAIIGSGQGVPQALAGMVFVGLGQVAFVPTLHAYLSARLPYAQRARGMGILEYSWALTGIVGLSLIGWLIAATSWRTPFFVLSAGMVLVAVVFGALPSAADERRTRVAHRTPRASSLVAYLDVGTNRASTYAALAAGAATYFAAMQFMLIHSAWYADVYGLGPRELGLVALLFGCFDLAASVSVSLFTDRIGKRRSVILGTAGSLVGYLVIPWLDVGMVPAVVSVAAARGAFEFASVSSFPLLSEQVPGQRAKVMSLSAATSLGAITIAAAVAPAVYTRMGIPVVAALSAGATVIALVLLLSVVREQTGTDVQPLVPAVGGETASPD
jgi:predicted MFS family arabinose efflux permease